jgi:hypothetical protein
MAESMATKVSFTVRFNEALEEMGTERTHRYTGVFASGESHFTMQDDKRVCRQNLSSKRLAR